MNQSIYRSVIFCLIFSFQSSFAAVPEQSPDLGLRDPKVNPCDNFYQYACGKWIQKTKIPADKPAWARSFSVIAEDNKLALKNILEKYAAKKFQPENPYAQKLGDFYGSCMDEAKLEKGSMDTLNEATKKIDSVTRENLSAVLAWMHLREMGAFFSFGSTQDFKNPEEVIAETSQGGLGLPSKDYYTKQDPHSQELRKKYVQHLQKMLVLGGVKAGPAKSSAENILKLETQLAEGALTPVELRDPKNVYHRLGKEELKKLAPSFDWDSYLREMGQSEIKSLNVAVPSFLKGFEQANKELSLEDLKSYLKIKLLQASAKGLPHRFYQEFFNFYGKTLSGTKEMQVRWKRCVDATNEMMGFALGRAYVDLHFAGASKDIAKSMIDGIAKSQGALLDQLPWMDAKTKAEAQTKLANISPQVGYPDKWRSYEGLEVQRLSYLMNRYEGRNFVNKYWLAKIGQPLDRSEWYMNPPEVNAYYDPQMAKIVFPAGILQPPFFHSTYSMAANYGAIGVVMGHEISHGFDDQGRQFDAKGAMRDWWTSQSAQEFDQRAQCLAQQYDQYPTVGGGHVNGSLTLGENIGDQGGLKLSYTAWKANLPKETAENPTKLKEEEQKFFLAFAQSWCSKTTDEYEKLIVNTDPHPPSRYRVNGALSNFPAFAKAFQCSVGTKMVPEKQCVVW